MQTVINLRELNESDLEMLLKWRNSDAVRLNMYNHELISLAEHTNWFHKNASSEDNIQLIFEMDNKPLGYVSFSKVDKKNGTAEWAFYSGNQAVRGVGTLMELIALKFAFTKLNLRKLSCEVLDFNAAVIKFHKKFGFIEEGCLRKQYQRGDEAFNIHLLSILKEEWIEMSPIFEAKYLVKYEVFL